MGPRMREDKGGVFTPILTFPPQGGREGKEGAHEGRPYEGRVRVGWWEWRTVMGLRGVERGPVRFLAEPRNDWGRLRMVRGNG